MVLTYFFFSLFWGGFFASGKITRLEAQSIGQPLVPDYKFLPAEMKNITAVASDKSNLFYGSGGKIISIDVKTNDKNWETDLGGGSFDVLYVHEKFIYAVGKVIENDNTDNIGKKGSERVLTALDRITGVTLWQTKLVVTATINAKDANNANDAKDTEDTKINSETDIEYLKIYLYAFKDYIILVSGNAAVHVFSRSEGLLITRKTLNAELSAPPVFERERVYIGTRDRRIFEVSLENLDADEKIRQVRTTPQTIIFEPAGGRLIFGDDQGRLTFINKSGKSRTLGFQAGGAITSVERTDLGILIASMDNFLYLFSADGERLVWKKRLAGRIQAAPLVSRKQVLVTTIEARDGMLIDLRSGRLIKKITLPEGDFLIGGALPASDFAIWRTLKGFIFIDFPS